MREQQVDGVFAQIPGRRTIAARLATGKTRNGLVRPDEIGLLLVATLLRGRNVCPAMVRDLMAARDHRLACGRVALDRKAGNEPRRLDRLRLEQRQDAPRAGEPKLATRQRSRRGHAAGDEARLGVEIERQTDDMARHHFPPNVDTSISGIA